MALPKVGIGIASMKSLTLDSKIKLCFGSPERSLLANAKPASPACVHWVKHVSLLPTVLTATCYEHVMLGPKLNGCSLI